MNRTFTLASAVSLAVLSRGAQAQIGIARPTAAECASIAASLTAEAHDSTFARAKMCGRSGAMAIASAIDHSRAAAAPQKLRVLTAAGSVVEPSVFESLLGYVQDRSQPAAVRTRALQSLLSVGISGIVLSRPEEFKEPNRRSCTLDNTFHYVTIIERVPRGTMMRAREIVGQLREDPGNPTEVRVAARCVYNGFRSGLDLPFDFDATRIALSYVCGDTFRVRNDHAEGFVNLRYEIVGTQVVGTISVARGEETSFNVTPKGNVKLYHGDDLIAEATHDARACPRR